MNNKYKTVTAGKVNAILFDTLIKIAEIEDNDKNEKTKKTEEKK